jgi:gas vesicle protein
MSTRTQSRTSDRSRFILIGALVGATIGLVGALVAAGTLEERQRRSESGLVPAPPKLGDIVKFSIAALMLLRQFADLLTPND